MRRYDFFGVKGSKNLAAHSLSNMTMSASTYLVSQTKETHNLFSSLSGRGGVEEVVLITWARARAIGDAYSSLFRTMGLFQKRVLTNARRYLR